MGYAVNKNLDLIKLRNPIIVTTPFTTYPTTISYYL